MQFEIKATNAEGVG